MNPFDKLIGGLKISEVKRAEMEGLPLISNPVIYPSGYLFNGLLVPASDGSSGGTLASPVLAGSLAVEQTKSYFLKNIYTWASDDVMMRIDSGLDFNDFRRPVGRSGYTLAKNKFLFPGEAIKYYLSGLVDAYLKFQFTVTAPAVSPAVNDLYSTNSSTYKVTDNSTAAAGIIKLERVAGTTVPATSGTLTRVTGAGDATLTFTANLQFNKVVATFTTDAIRLSADNNYAAKQSIYFIGDSNTVGVFGSLTSAQYSRFSVYSWILRQYFIDNGNDVRIIDKATSNYTSADFEGLRQKAMLDLPEAPAITFYNIGTNDSSSSIYLTNLDSFVKWYVKKWPTSKLVILGPIPRQNGGASAETLLASIRTVGQTYVTTLANPNVIHIDLGAAWNVASNNYYSDDQAAGSGLHMNVLGNSTAAAYIINKIDTLYPSFKALT